ncbi:MAG TPA: hemerythrin domain-containing protein [Nocardioidaceae bacterium]|nr:hemerythrin domain-containing protein [Nocardioidaceae bacterium]
MTTQGSETIIDILTSDHREVEQLFEQAKSAGSGEQRRELADQIIADLVRHSVAEEQHLYPAVRQHLDNGNERADHELSEHDTAEQMMKEIESLGADDPQLATKLGELEQEIKHHVEEEEREVFPELSSRVDNAGLVDLGDKIKQAKEQAPTRPHPSSPDSPGLLKLLGPGAGLVDRLRDRLSGRNV